MQIQHHLQPEQAQSLRQNPPADPGIIAEQSAPIDIRIEAYLDRACAAIDTSVSHASRDEIRCEMLAHIEALVEANLELGDAKELAIAHALDQFGRLGSIQREWRRTAANSSSLRQPLQVGLGFSLGACLMMLTAIPMGMHYAEDAGMSATQTISNSGLFLLPALAGLLTGLTARRRPVVAALCGMLALLAPMMVIDALQSNSMGSGMWSIGLISQASIFGVFWIPISCASAAVGGAVKRLMNRTRRSCSATREDHGRGKVNASA